jgi:carboxyl-terminal processing protease
MLRRVLLPAVLLLAALCAGMWLGGHPDRLPGFAQKAFVDEDYLVVGEALGVLNRRYYREVPTRKVEEAALRAAVDSLDDQFSTYLSPKDLKAFDEMTDSKFEGIGVEVQQVDAGLRIGKVYEGSPAEKAELKSDDIIVRAGGESLAGLTTQEGSALIRGPEGTSVDLQLRRDSELIDRKVKRAQVRVPVVESRFDEKTKVGVVRLGSFTTDANEEVKEGVDSMVKKGATGIVLDLRSNPGGLVSEAKAISSLFLDGGTIVTTRGRAVRTKTIKAGDDPAFPKIPLVVLVDKNSASAAEIVTGALQDRGRAKVYGTRTYGKGVFQEIIPLSQGGAMDITVGQYFTPKGRNLGGAGAAKGQDVSRGQGIAPDEKAVDDPETPKVDEAEQTAIDAVKQ